MEKTKQVIGIRVGCHQFPCYRSNVLLPKLTRPLAACFCAGSRHFMLKVKVTVGKYRDRGPQTEIIGNQRENATTRVREFSILFIKDVAQKCSSDLEPDRNVILRVDRQFVSSERLESFRSPQLSKLFRILHLTDVHWSNSADRFRCHT